jgi:hypothetical protein
MPQRAKNKDILDFIYGIRDAAIRRMYLSMYHNEKDLLFSSLFLVFPFISLIL